MPYEGFAVVIHKQFFHLSGEANTRVDVQSIIIYSASRIYSFRIYRNDLLTEISTVHIEMICSIGQAE